MPAIRLANVAAGTANALDGLRFQEIPAGGGYVTIYASTAVATGNIDFSVENEEFLSAAVCNTETAADVIDTSRDLILPREPVPAGKMYLSVNTQICNVLVIIE